MDVLGAHPETAAAHMKIGSIHNVSCDYDEAVDEYTQPLAILESVLGRDHKNSVNACSELGLLLYYQGRYDNARRHQESAL